MSQAVRARPEVEMAREKSPEAPSAGRGSFPFALPEVSPRTRGFLLLFLIWIVLKNTWLCEDAFITYRVVDNFVHGLGLRWNPLERVQTFTHPLWTLLVSAVYFIARDVYFAPVVVSLACTGAAMGLLLYRGLKSLPQCLLATTILASSKAFMDFSTSGLENPLSHLLLALFFLEELKSDDERRFDRQVWYASLAITNRMDLVWLIVPSLAYQLWKGGQARKLRSWVGLAPFVGWEIFSLLYYGFLFPNTAYAKLTSGVHVKSILMQGECYFLNSLSWDPITLFAIVGLVGIALFTLRKERAPIVIAVGILFQLAYTIRVGGDYMTGRFLTAPLFVSMFILSRVEFERPGEFAVVLALVLGLALYSPRPPIQTTDGYVGLGTSPQGVDDEHGYRHNDTSLLKLSRGQGLRGLGGWIADGVKAHNEHTPVAVYRNIGYYGFFAGPEVHIIDPYGIGDPLMARMPFPEDGRWSPGHFYRDVPEGYVDAALDKGDFADPGLSAYWAKLKLVTRGPIFDWERLKEVARFNLGMNPVPPIPPKQQP